MKCKVLFDFPIGFNNQLTPSGTVIVDFPDIPRRGDRVSKNDENFAPLFKQINDYFESQKIINVLNIAFNVIKYILYKDGEPIVVVGNDPDKLVMYGAIPNEDRLILTSTRDLPRIGDSICGREWYVNSVNLINQETVQVGLADEPIDDEEDE